MTSAVDASPEAWIGLGRVLEAHQARFWARRQVAPAKRETAQAAKEAQWFGRFEDCGDAYDSFHDEAKATESERIGRKIASEKHFKRTKLTYLEAYPAMEAELDRRIEQQAREHTRTEIS